MNTTPTSTALIAQMDAIHPFPGSLAIWALGQMGFAIKGDGDFILYIDPYLSDLVNALSPDGTGAWLQPRPLNPDEVTNAGAVLCTHEHIDHTDPDTLPSLAAASPEAPIYVTGWARETVIHEMGIAAARVRVPKGEQPFEVGPAHVTPIPSAHYELEEDPEKGHRWLGFLIEWNGVRLYHAGDTIVYDGYIERLRQCGPIDVAILPVNGRDWMREARDLVGNLHPTEAVALAKELGWKVLIPAHNLFEGNHISPGPIFDAGLQEAPTLRIHQLIPGELYFYVK